MNCSCSFLSCSASISELGHIKLAVSMDSPFRTQQITCKTIHNSVMVMDNTQLCYGYGQYTTLLWLWTIHNSVMVMWHRTHSKGPLRKQDRKPAAATCATFRLAARPTERTAHTTIYVTPVTEHCLKQEIAQWVHHVGSIRRPIAPSHHELPRSYISLLHT